MSRTTSINVNVNSGQSISTISKLRKAFEELKVAKDEVAKDGKIKLDIQLTGLDKEAIIVMSKAISKLSGSMKKLKENSQAYTDLGKTINVESVNVTNNLNRTIKVMKNVGNESKGMTDKLMETAIAFEVFQRGFGSFWSSYTKLNSASFNVGIASQMNISQIEALNHSFLQLSRNVPSSATEMANAVDALIRTGRSFEDSRKIIEQVAILSTASGDSLKDTSEVVTKVMVSLGISGDKVKDTLTAMHSTAIQTASDMGYLAEAFKNVAGTASVLVKQSGLSGKELEDYRQRILDVTMASIGSMANLGLSASQAGTKVKNLMGKLVAGEKSARALFDTAMKLNNIKLSDIVGGEVAGKKGQIFDFDALSNMTKKDLPEALRVMSELYMKGQLSTQVMQKMFTARHFMEISNLLIDINGNIDGFVDGIAKGVSYSNDFYKKMFDINEQLKVFRNRLEGSFGNVGETLTQSGTGVLMLLNKIPEINNGFTKLIGQFGGLTAVASGTAIAVGAFVKLLMPLFLAGGGIGLAIGAVVAGIGLIGKHFYEMKKNVADFNLNFDTTALTAKKVELSIKSINDKYTLMNKLIAEAGDNKSLVNSVDEANTLMGLLLSNSKEFVDMINSLNEQKAIDSSMKVPPTIMSDLSEIRKQYNEFSENLKTVNENMVNSVVKSYEEAKTRLPESDKAKLDEIIANRRNFVRDYLALAKQEQDIEVRLQKAREMGQKKYGFSSGIVEDMLQKMSRYSGDLDLVNQDLLGAEEKLKKLQDQMNDYFKEFQDQMTKNGIAFNKLVADVNSRKIDLFLKTGNVEIDKQSFTGVKGVIELFQESLGQNFESKLKLSKDTLQGYEEMKSALEDTISLNGKATAQQKSQLEDLNKKISIERENITLIENEKKAKGAQVDAQKDLYYEQLKGYEVNKNSVVLMLQYLTILQRIANADTKDEGNMEMLNKELELILKQLDYGQQQIDSKKRTSDYQLKYNNYVKENLSLELELAKVLQSQGKQQLLTLEYKKKELEMNKELIKDEVRLARKTLAEQGFNASGIVDSKQAQEELKKMYEKHGSVTQSEKVKKQFDALKILVQALAKEEKVTMEIALQPLKEFENVIENLPSVMEKAYTSLKGISRDTTLSPMNLEYINYLNSNIESTIDRVKESWKDKEGISLFEGLTTVNIDDFITKYKDAVLVAEEQARLALSKRDKGDELTESELEYISILSKEEKKLKDLISLKDKMIDADKKALEVELARLDVINQMGDVFSKLGSSMSIKGLEDIGNIFSSLGDLTKFNQELNKDPKNKFDFSKLFDTSDMTKWTDNFSKMLESSLKNIDLGSTVGSWIGSVTGGGVSSQAGGALGGLVAGAGGADALAGALGMAGSALATGGASLAISAGMALIGGLFDSGEDDQEEANKRTAEAKKIYDKNTEALNKLAQNMSNLSGGIDGLNNSLVSSFSKIPTIGKLGSVENSLRDMYKTMEKTRKFNDVAYQVTKTKKGKSGFLGIGAKAGSTWTETIEMSVQELLNKYGFKGTIEEMTTQQMREFSAWLEDFDLGDTDNFSVLAGAIEDYAEALDKFDKNINKFFYDTTMESFVGISSLQQEELRQQIEDFYKNLGFQIDEAMSKEIDKLAEEMSVMVTIMQDVRGKFIDTWRDSGKTAGQAFLSSMSPYIDAMLNNMSQIFYDVYFSDVTKALEDEFKSLSEQLVELKRQGASLDWDSVADNISGSFNKVLGAIISAKQETESFNDIILELQKQAIEAGLSLSEILELGLMSGTQKTVLETFKDSLLSTESEGALTAIGQMVGDKVGEAMADKLIDNMLSDKVLQFSANIDKVLSGGMNFDSLSGLASEALSVGMMMEEQRKRLEAIKGMFDFNGDISYESQESNIQYQTGTSTQVVNQYYLNSSVEAGNVIESDSIERLADSLLDTLIEKLKVDRGIDITKNY